MRQMFCCPYIRSVPTGVLGIQSKCYCVLSQEHVDRETLDKMCYTNRGENFENCPVYKYKDFTEKVEPKIENNGILS